MYETVRLNEYQRVVRQLDVAVEALEEIKEKGFVGTFKDVPFYETAGVIAEQALKQI